VLRRYEAVTNASLEVYPFLARFKPFFFVFCILLIGVIILVIALGYALGFDVTMPLIIVYVIVSIAFLIFYSVTVGKIVNKVAKSNNMRQKKSKFVRDVSIIVNYNTLQFARFFYDKPTDPTNQFYLFRRIGQQESNTERNR